MGNKFLSLALTAGLMLPAVTPAVAATPAIQSVQFKGMPAPTTVEEMAKPYSTASVEVTYAGGAKKTFPLSYKELYKTSDGLISLKGKKIAAGTPLDVKGNPITDKSVTDLPVTYVSDCPDANSLLQPIDKNLYLVTHLEYTSVDSTGHDAWRRIPASMVLSKLDQDKKTGELKVAKADKIDVSSIDGIWVPCNGSLSPWNSHLSSEEYEPDARQFELEENLPADEKANRIHKGEFDRNNTREFARLYFGVESKANPYLYGFPSEVTVSADGKAKVVKHYSLGRRSNELMVVMPDNRTAFFGDDGDYTMLFMYVADKEKDLTSGALYAARFTQTGTENGGSGNLTWIKLGHATDSEVRTLIDKGVKFSDIFETASEPQEGFTAVKQYSSERSEYKRVEYLKVKPGMEKAAAFLEPRRFGAILGATSEWNKMEGLAINKKDKVLYVAISDQSKGMEKDSKGEDPTDHIQLPKRKSGVTYAMKLTGSQQDLAGNAIPSAYVGASIAGLIIGEDLKEADAYGNTANVDKIASPDNLSYSEELRTLFIGEDSSLHVNNYVWAYNIDTGALSRILSVPAGAEATGLSFANDRNGFAYIMSNFQHPGDEVAKKKITAVDPQALMNALAASPYGILKSGGVGYIQGLPSLTSMVNTSK
ncbi:DUF839 domain-containing protein [Heliobacterium gestii]|uniref:DUF839 domain-containing protein n=1 Tax=Heliomicrobium gestii TaxID=2699 RepID=A0A845LCU7_HELGE|nr:alkaline phosphatase PhoX [Heliomicrobium gestii]MBM7868301.1 secreted PhoX family phosphatase [Heliomicrobium gestii]MZP44492.1 DUF839 domain-containing protein [Heliomicrobium gestii]